MANLTQLNLTAGAPTDTGTVGTIDALMADGGQATLGVTTGTAVVSDATGTLQQYLRGLVKMWAAAIVGGANSLFTKITDGTNTAAVKAASTAPGATDPSLVVAISPNSRKATTITNGTTRTRVNSTADTNATTLKGSAGKVMAVALFNNAAYDVFFKFYEKATAPTVGSDTPVWTIPLKSGGGISLTFGELGEDFATGISYAITKLQADSDTTAIAAVDVTGKINWI